MIDFILKECDYKMVIIDKVDLEVSFDINKIYENKDLENSKVKFEINLKKDEGLKLIIKNINLEEYLKEEDKISLSIFGFFRGKAVGVILNSLNIIKMNNNKIIAFTNLEDNFSEINFL